MRIIVYLLALLTGLSAAQNAEARRDAPAALGVAAMVADAAQASLSGKVVSVDAHWQPATPAIAAQKATALIPIGNIALPPRTYRSDRARE
ncbi:MAG: hypothetical protein V3V15_06670 [Sphingorhabdus sp.]